MADTKTQLAVLDVDIPELLENKIFNRELANKVHHTILPMVHLYEQALAAGITMVTPDVYLGMPKGTPAQLVTHMGSPLTAKAIQHGAVPTILYCLESPFIATRFYAKLKSISSQFRHSFVFAGMKKHLSPRTSYHEIFFPETFDVQKFSPLPFEGRTFVTMISGNKRMGSFKKTMLLKFMYGFGVHEIYDLRMDVIKYFGAKGGFDLYGVGWDKPQANPENEQAVRRIYRGKVDSKFETLQSYTFAFCFENSVFPGYITEKIFDVFFAGCIPVYCGAPDIADYVPRDTFLDVRDFKDFDEMYERMASMTKDEFEGYMQRIREFLHSPSYARFTEQSFAHSIVTVLKQESAHE